MRPWGYRCRGRARQNWFGTDEIGRDILSRVIYSAQSDVVISLAATAIAFVVGSLIGIFLGYRGGFVDTAGSRVVDVMLAFPAIVLALFLIAIFGHGEPVEIVAIAAVMMPSMARFARGTSLLLRHRAYIESSEILRAFAFLRHPEAPFAERASLSSGGGIGARCQRRTDRGGAELPRTGRDTADTQLGDDALQRVPKRIPGAVLRSAAWRVHHPVGLWVHAARTRSR